MQDRAPYQRRLCGSYGVLQVMKEEQLDAQGTTMNVKPNYRLLRTGDDKPKRTLYVACDNSIPADSKNVIDIL